MKFVMAANGSRGDVEPCAAVAVELLRRGHDVRMAVPPEMLGFIESAGLSGIACGPDSRKEISPTSDLAGNVMPDMQSPLSAMLEVAEPGMGRALHDSHGARRRGRPDVDGHR